MFNIYNLLLQSISDVGTSTASYAGFGDSLSTMYWVIIVFGVAVAAAVILGAIMFMARDEVDQAGIATKSKSTAISVGFILMVLLAFASLMTIWIA